ncbi:hypothetical protein D9615_002709 [Tricholomella constricta]|uniref:Chitinase n=1 Tax=Tricholomella constricta TaxID=117010 RepID=A0A8H5HFZ5_9AGAR|nr:hypothetical protein D9615_002709 [Tricholomella constricta]
MALGWLPYLSKLLLFLTLPSSTSATTCTIATVGSPYSTCFDIYTNAQITSDQFFSFNPGLDCNLLQIGQKVCISAGTLPSNAPVPYQNGTCFMYTAIPGDYCAAIAVKFDITTAQIETWNTDTYKWKGCANLQLGFTMCVSPGTPPPIAINPDLQCGPESPGNAACALKACCSAFGYCGVTDEFCSTSGPDPCISNCFTPTLPSCSASRTMRNIGYYAGWATRRPCGVFAPNEMDWTGYTHAHFAFAIISQSFELVIANEDIPLLNQLVARKSEFSGLQVIIAVGGWDFSELEPTRDLFSLMIATSSSRATFISSATAFLANYGLDGIDIDFEYPGAMERNGPATDTPNLTAFFNELRAALPSTSISVAAPAGFWFLRGFEIDKIASSVSYINMMSYDYHGPWDTNITGQAPVTSPHTSLLDMETSALLYIRAGIDLSKVNLGLAWYGRTYRLSDKTCVGYNCTMLGGGTPGRCTGASGYLAQFEVLELAAAGNTVSLDPSSQTYWLNDPDGDLVTFDQADTWQVKENFAATTCFGGTFVWSIDQANVGDSGGGSDPSNSFSIIPWNPNPFPATTAISQTFVGSGSTVIIPVPTATTSVTIGGEVITLAAGGTPLSSLVPTGISQPDAVTPTWTYYISPPSGAASVTFTAPVTAAPTFSSIVPVPTASDAPAQSVSGPPGGSTCNGGNIWQLLFGPSIGGCLPPDIGIPGGTTPTAVPPSDWTGVWTNPVPPFSVSTVAQSYTYITWNPNPYPSPAAVSETFIRSDTTIIIAIPTTTTSITLGPDVITLNSGGTPVNSPVPTDVTQPNAITPIWTYNIMPPPDATSVFFTAPLTSTPTYSSLVPIPVSSDSPGNPVNGPPGDHHPCDPSNAWFLLFGGLLSGCLPFDVGIIGGITPHPIRPPGWTGIFINPYPLITKGSSPDEGSSTQTSTTTSTTSTSACAPWNTGMYDLPDDSVDADWEENGTDPSYLRKRGVNHRLVARAPPQFEPRRIAISNCPSAEATSPSYVALQAGTHYFVDGTPATGSHLFHETVASRPPVSNQEHVFELGYIKQFFDNLFGNISPEACTWITDNVFQFIRTDGTDFGAALIAAMDRVENMVWVDVPLNQAKSSLVNGNSDTPANPPRKDDMDYLRLHGDFTDDNVFIHNLEFNLQNLEILGSYMTETSDIFKNIALQVQNLLSELTPSTPIFTSSLPTLFYRWLHDVAGSYPNGCTLRGENAYAYYRTTMDMISARTQEPVPQCFTLYHQNNYSPTSINNFADLLPPAPRLRDCNPPGSTGSIGYLTRSNGAS